MNPCAHHVQEPKLGGEEPVEQDFRLPTSGFQRWPISLWNQHGPCNYHVEASRHRTGKMGGTAWSCTALSRALSLSHIPQPGPPNVLDSAWLARIRGLLALERLPARASEVRDYTPYLEIGSRLFRPTLEPRASGSRRLGGQRTALPLAWLGVDQGGRFGNSIEGAGLEVGLRCNCWIIPAPTLNLT